MQARRLTEGHVGLTLVRFALPYMMSNFLQALYGAADLFMVGHFTGSAAVSAVATGSQVMQMMTNLMLGLSMGGTVLIGRRVGEEDQPGIATAIGTLSALLVIAAAILSPLAALNSGRLARFMRSPEEAREMAGTYIFICSLGIPFITGYNAVSSVFRGLGNSKSPAVFIAIACMINMIADYVLVGVCHMGAAGAALATVAAQGISFFCALGYMKKKGFDFPFSWRCFRLERPSLRAILAVGAPLATQDTLVSLSFMIIMAIINSLGLVASASVGVVEKIISFAMLLPTAFGAAVAAMTAQNVGAGLPKRAIRVLISGVGYSLVFGILVCVYAQFLPETLTSIFSDDPLVIVSAGQYLKSFAIDCIFVAFVFNLNGYFNGCGHSVISLTHSLISTFLVRIPLSYLLGTLSHDSLYPMGLAAPAASVVSIVILLGYFAWMKKHRPEA